MTFSRRRFRQNRVAFVPPKCAARSFRQKLSLSPHARKLRGSLLITIGNNGSQHEVVRCRPGTVTDRVLGGPGSAMHHSLTLALHRIRDTQQTRVSLVIHLTISNSPSRSRGACLRPGFAILASPTRIEGWAERRETFGCSGTRGACHLASKTRVNALMTRHARRLRGALRPMTRDARLSALHRGVSFLRSFPRKRESSISRSPLSRGRAEGG